MVTYMDTTTHLHGFSIKPLISTDFRATCMGYKPEVEYKGTGTFLVRAETPKAACDLAFAICNSYPDELHCDPRHTAKVIAYRAAGNRSLSVGDAVEIQGSDGVIRRFACASVGWVEIV